MKRTRHKEIDTDDPESYSGVLTDKFFDDQIGIAELLIENAILTGTYVPRLTEHGSRIGTLLATSGLNKVNIIAEPEPSTESGYEWQPQQIEELISRAYSLSPILSTHLRRRLGIAEHQVDDVIQVTITKFFERVRDGRLPDKYGDPKHLARLLIQMATYTAIDQLREVSGRNGNTKPIYVSLDTTDDRGLTLTDRIGVEDQGFDPIERKNIDAVKRILPFLAERERRALILSGYFGLTRPEIAQIIGSTDRAVQQLFQNIKKKVAKIAENNKAPEE